MRKYGTIKRGRVKFKLGSRQHKYLLWKKLPYSVVTVKDSKKSVKRVNVRPHIRKVSRVRGYCRRRCR